MYIALSGVKERTPDLAPTTILPLDQLSAINMSRRRLSRRKQENQQGVNNVWNAADNLQACENMQENNVTPLDTM